MTVILRRRPPVLHPRPVCLERQESRWIDYLARRKSELGEVSWTNDGSIHEEPFHQLDVLVGTEIRDSIEGALIVGNEHTFTQDIQGNLVAGGRSETLQTLTVLGIVSSAFCLWATPWGAVEGCSQRSFFAPPPASGVR